MSEPSINTVVSTNNQSHANGRILDVWLAGKRFYEDGFKSGERDRSIYCVAHFLFFGCRELGLSAAGYGQEELRRKRLTDWASSLGRDSAEMREHIDRIVAWIPKHRRSKSTTLSERLIDRLEATRSDLTRFKLANEKRQQMARDRILEAYNQLKRDILEPSINAVAKLARSNWATVKRVLSSLQGSIGEITRTREGDPESLSSEIVSSDVQKQKKEKPGSTCVINAEPGFVRIEKPTEHLTKFQDWLLDIVDIFRSYSQQSRAPPAVKKP